MMADIHPTALVEEGAWLAEDASVGPYCVVGSKVTLEQGVRLSSHVVVAGRTTIGAQTTIHPFASLGQPSPDRKYKGEDTALIIGARNDIREYVTMHIGTDEDRGETRVGDENLFMAMTHVAHDCTIGSHCIFANSAMLAGHVVVEDHAIVGGLSGVHQRVRIGRYAIIGGHTGVDRDVPPFSSVAGERAHLEGVNLVGLRRKGLGNEDIRLLQEAYAQLFGEGDLTLAERIEQIIAQELSTEGQELVNFVREARRGVTQP
jgi:UDP-N-acetylglucosamine acyltransferase